MTPDRWQHIDELFHRALEREPAERATFLAEMCPGDDALYREVASLLAAHEQAGSFYERAPAELATRWLEANQAPSVVGQTLGHFKIIELIGEGGMGQVYLAQDTKLDRRVAVKLLPTEFTSDEHRLRRFKQEARAASALNHPNIITIYEIGDAGDTHYIATEFIAGQTLRALLKPGALPLDTMLDVAAQVASALSAAHDAGILHRDIKPENIMVRPDGLVKVLDFGLARMTEQPAIAPDSPVSTFVKTESGMVMGTAQYMSPEQARGQAVDARTDVFSFGVVLYEMIAGHVPFEGETASDVIAAILKSEPPSLASYAPDIPRELERIVTKALGKDRAERYQTIKDLLLDLKALKQELEARAKESVATGTVTALGLKRRWLNSRIGLAWAAMLLVAGLVGLFVWQPWRTEPPAEPPRAAALTTLPGVERSPSLSPDGNHVVFAWTGPKQDNQDIYVQMIGQGSPLRLTTDPRNDYNPVWSPDGRWIAFFRSEPPATTGLRRRELRLIPPLGGPERKLADVRGQDFFPAAAYLAWSPDSNSLVVTDSPGEGKPDALFVVSLETGEKRPLTNPPPPVFADIAPAVSPDGRSLVFLRRTTWGAGELHLLPLGEGLTAAGQPKRLTPAELRADFPAWMPDGKEIIFSATGSLWRLAIAGENAPTRIPYVGEDGLMPVISRAQSGKSVRLVYVRSFADTNLWRIETSAPGAPSSSAPVMAISSTRHESHGQFSPDGQRVAFSSGRSGEQEIWVSDPDGSNAVQLTSMQAQDTTWPHWSPDGQLIAFSSNGEGEFDIYVIPATGGKPRRLTSHPAVDIQPAFSRDGQWIYFTSMRSGDYRIWKMPTNGGEAVQVTPNQGRGAFESPDGGHLYYHSVSVVAPLWRLPTSGGEPVKVLDGVVWYNFCLLERGAYYIDRLGRETQLQYLDFATGKSTTVARNLGEVGAGLTASPDGRTILFTRVDSSADDLMLVENFR